MYTVWGLSHKVLKKENPHVQLLTLFFLKFRHILLYKREYSNEFILQSRDIFSQTNNSNK